MNQLFTSLNSGELSELLTCRHDLAKRSAGCKILENFIVLEHGGVMKRPGVQKVGKTDSERHLLKGANHRLVAFESSMKDCFVLDITRFEIRIFNSSGNLVSTLQTGWADDSLELFQFCQVNDVLWAFHPKSHIFKISWHGGNDFRRELFNMTVPPWEHPNGYEQNISLKGVAHWAQLYVTSPHGTFAGKVGTKIRLTRQIPAQTHEFYKQVPAHRQSLGGSTYELMPLGYQFYQTGEGGKATCWRCIKTFTRDQYTGSNDPASYPQHFALGAIQNQDSIIAMNGWTINTSGNWQAVWELHRAENLEDGNSGLKWELFQRISSYDEAPANHNLSGTEHEPAVFRMLLVNFWTNKPAGNPRLHIARFRYDYIGTIVATNGNGTEATVQLDWGIDHSQPPLNNEFWTNNWSLEAFRQDTGFARTGVFHQGRLWLGGNERQPQTVWASRVDDLANFKLGSDADDALSLTIMSQSRDRIVWLGAADGILVGTESSEWSIAGGQGKSIGPGSFEIKRQSGEGSAAFQPLVAPQSLIYVKQGSTKLLELAYSFQNDGWQSQDLTLLAEHVPKAGIRQYALQRLPWNITWCVLKDGTLAGVTYNRAQNVVSWHRHRLGNDWKVHSCCVTHDPRNGSASGYDALWLAVEREGRMELMKMTFDPKYCSWTDDGTPYPSRLTLMPADIVAKDGHTLGQRKRVTGVALRILEEGGPGDGESECLTGTEENGALSPVRFDNIRQGWLKHPLASNSQKEICFTLVHDKPKPFTLLAIDLQWEPNM